MNTRTFWVYIMGGAGRTIYIGVTNNLTRRIWEHKTKAAAGFTARYNLDRLLFYAQFHDARQAIAYEKKIKGWIRVKKDALIEEMNPHSDDLAADWYEMPGDSLLREA
jgi:putative endonuclease